MIVANHETFERIRVYHNSFEEMHATVDDLMAQGYSDNIRMENFKLGGSGKCSQLDLSGFETERLKEEYPGLIIHQDETRYSGSRSFIYCTEHERKDDKSFLKDCLYSIVNNAELDFNEQQRLYDIAMRGIESQGRS